MKTKKEILRWYEERGMLENNGPVNDYFDFWDKINKNEVVIIEKVKGEGEKQEHKITILKDSWKYPIKLYFYDLECYKIVGF